ncbi:kinetochore scaffold 1 [Amia ocellicauda]|uniref:kinetochore scaffold 1 n=1 Tax=Amia ocellicauda TaxID=2972642 RepID=UPI00346441F6
MKMEPYGIIPSDKAEQTKSTRSRRISSILKAPRTPLKSIGIDHGAPQECAAKPFEKKRRSSRRVSFAETNDIKDFKNDSPVTKLLQDLDGTETDDLDKENRMSAAYKEKLPITGMETLLYAPLQVPQQQHEENVFYQPAIQGAMADKTIVFSGEDHENMDMTYSHTIIIDKDENDDKPDASSRGNVDFREFLSGLDKPKNCGNNDSRREEYNHFRSYDTKDFPASLSKSNEPSDSRVFSNDPKSVTPLVQQNVDSTTTEKVNFRDFLSRLNAHGAGADFGNKGDVSSSGKPDFRDSRFDEASGQDWMKTSDFKDFLADQSESKGQSGPESVSCDPKSVTLAAHQNLPLSRTEKVNTKDFLSRLRALESGIGKENQVPESKEMGANKNPFAIGTYSSFPSHHNDTCNVTQIFSGREEMDVTQCQTSNIRVIASTLNHVPARGQGLSERFPKQPDSMEITRGHSVVLDAPSLLDTSHQKHFTTQGYRHGLQSLNKTVLSGEQDDMDMTKSHTVCIDSKFYGHKFAVQPEEQDDMEITRSQTVAIDCNHTAVGNPSILVHKRNRKSLAGLAACGDKTVVFSEELDAMDITKSHTVAIDNTFFQSAEIQSNSRNNVAPYPGSSKLDDMDLTRSQTVSIDYKTAMSSNPAMDFNRGSREAFGLSIPADKTVVFSVDENDMDITRSQTVAIDCNHTAVGNPSILVHKRNRKSLAGLAACGDKTVVFSEELDAMDITKSHTVAIDNTFFQSAEIQSNSRNNVAPYPGSSKLDDMDLTRSQTVSIDYKTAMSSNPAMDFNRGSREAFGLSIPADKTVVFSVDQNDMDITKSHTVAIDSRSFLDQKSVLQNGVEMSGVPVTGILRKPRKSMTGLSVNSDETVVFPGDIDMDMTKSHTVSIDSKHLVPKMERPVMVNNCMPSALHSVHVELNDLDIKKSQTEIIDYNNLVTINPVLGTCQKSRKSQFGLSIPSDKTIFFSMEQDDMNMTKSHTIAIDHKGLFEQKSLLQNEESDDMEMTRSQTIAIDYKNFVAADPFMGIPGKYRKSVIGLSSCDDKSSVFSENIAEMEITKSQTVVIDGASILQNSPNPAGEESGLYIFDNIPGSLSVCPDPDDMEITRSQTVKIDLKTVAAHHSAAEINRSLRQSALGLSVPADRTVVYSENLDDMDITKSYTVAIDSKGLAYLSENTMQCLTNGNLTISEGPDDMHLTRSQTDASSHWQQNTKPVQTIALQSPVSSHPDDKEMTRGHTVSTDYQTNALMTSKTSRESMVGFSVPDLQDDLEITRSQTVLIDRQSCGSFNNFFHTETELVPGISIPNKTIIFSEDDRMEMTKSLTVAFDGGSVLKVHKCKEIALEESNRQCPTNITLNVSSADYHDGTRSQAIRAGCESIRESISCSSLLEPKAALEKSYGPCDKTEFEDASLTFCKVKGMDGAHSVTFAIDTNATIQMSKESLSSVNQQKLDCIFLNKHGESEHDQDQRHSVELIKTDIEITSTDNPNPELRRKSVCFKLPDPKSGSEREVTINGTHLTSEDGKVMDESTRISMHNPQDSVAEIDEMTIRRRRSLADLRSKIKTIKNAINEPAETGVAHQTAPSPKLQRLSELEMKDENTQDFFGSKGCVNDDGRVYNGGEVNVEESAGPNTLHSVDHSLYGDQAWNTTAPVNICSVKPKTTRMSLGGYLPKLPHKKKTIEVKPPEITENSSFGKLLVRALGASAETQMRNNETDHNIHEEILPDCSDEEDSAENITGELPPGNCLNNTSDERALSNIGIDDPDFVKSMLDVTASQKRPFPEGGHEDEITNERKVRRSLDGPSADQGKEASKFIVQWDSNAVGITAESLPSLTTKTFDSTSSSSNTINTTNLKGTYDTSAQRSAQFESQFMEEEEFECGLREKLQDGSITIKEFFQLLEINILIQRPRQSTLPHNFASDSALDPEVLLRERFIYRPKQQVYEEDCQALSETVEILKARIPDQEKALKTINESLWETVKTYSEEQLKSLGSKLNERKLYFRKKSKAFFHETKIGLYSKLVQSAKLAKQDLKEKIELTEDLLQNLDDCLHNLEAEVSGLDSCEMQEGNVNSELALVLQARQEELENLKVLEADYKRKEFELQRENDNIADKVCRLQAKTHELENNIQDLNRLTEWTLIEWTDDRAVFSFLNGSLEIELVFDAPCEGTDKPGQNVLDVKFYTLLDDERVPSSSLVIHKLITQFIKSHGSWCQKYPKQQDVPLLLHDLSLVVSRCRLLGEELHYLDKWGCLKFDILDMSVSDTNVRILFSSYKAFAKFDIAFAITPAYPSSRLELLSFQNYIGDIRRDQIEDSISAVKPEEHYLTKIIQKIQQDLLCKKQ